MLEVGEDVSFGEGEFVLRRGQSEAGLHVIVEGEVGVVLDDVELAVLPRGSFFGEISSLLGEAVVADVISRSPLRCLVIPPGAVEAFLLAEPISKLMGQTVAAMLTRIFGILLAALAAQFVIDGIRNAFHIG